MIPKKILVTGADGFIGSHLSETLVSEGFEVRALCQYNSFSHCGWLDQSNFKDAMEIIMGDIRDPRQTDLLMKGVDTVFHLAALIAIPYSYQAPNSYVSTNICGTMNLLNSALNEGVERFIQTSTSEVYGTALYAPIDESHPLQAQSPYAASKVGADAIALSYYKSFNLPVIVARPFNTYGPRQSARAVIPSVISQILSGQRQLHMGKLSPTRDFNYVLDTCAGFLSLAQCDAAIGRTINIGSGKEISIRDTVDLISKIAGVDLEIVCDEKRLRPEASEVERLICDNSLINELTGFLPKYTLEEGLSLTISWLQDPLNLSRYNPTVYNV